MFSGKELHELLDIGVHQINAQHLASVRPHTDDEIPAADTVDNKEITIVASNREPPR